jgi:hypothetical protein
LTDFSQKLQKTYKKSQIFQDFYIVNTWELDVNATDLSDAFIICGVLYGLESAEDRDTYIAYGYDLFR